MERNRYTFQTPKCIGKNPQNAVLAFLIHKILGAEKRHLKTLEMRLTLHQTPSYTKDIISTRQQAIGTKNMNGS
jgi:hypothetical protein